NARLAVSADDEAEVFLNSVAVANCRRWSEPARAEVSVRLNQGENVLAVRARNRSGDAGLLVHLNLNGQTNVFSDASWLTTTNEEVNWSALHGSLGRGARSSHGHARRGPDRSGGVSRRISPFRGAGRRLVDLPCDR